MKEMIRLKKIITGILLASMTLSLCACEVSSSDETSSAVVSGETSDASVDEEEDEASDVTGELTPVSIGIDPAQLAYVQIIALEEGFFEENGLDVELLGYASGVETINAVVLGEVQIGAVYDYAACTRLAEKTNLRLTTSFVINSDDAFWFETTVEGAASAADLAGKKIGLVQGTAQEYLWAKELESVNLTTDDVDINYFGSSAELYTAYATDQVDAVPGVPSFQEQLDAVQGRTVLGTLADIGQTMQGYIMADSTFLNEQPEVMENYYKSLQQAIDYIDENKDAAAQTCADYLTLKKEDVLSAFDSYQYEIRFLQRDYDHIQEIADWCYENGVTDEIEVKDYMDITAVSEVYPDQVTYEEK